MARGKNTAPAVAEEVKEVKAVVEEAPKKATRKPTAKKETAKKTPAKKPAAKAAVQTNLFIQYQGAEVSYADLIEKAKADAGVKSPKNINIYVKPEDNTVYYVIDEKEGSFVLA